MAFYHHQEKSRNFHSLLRKDTRNWSTGPEIQNTARTIGSSGFLAYFKEWCISTYQRGTSEANYWKIAVETAKYLLELFKKIAANMDKASEVYTCCLQFIDFWPHVQFTSSTKWYSQQIVSLLFLFFNRFLVQRPKMVNQKEANFWTPIFWCKCGCT